MDSPQKFKSTVAFTDLLFNILVGFVFLFLIAFLMINPVAKKGDIITPAEFIIALTWPEDSADDIDIWVRGPDMNVVGFTRKDSPLIHLDRDDRGVLEDKMEIDGKEVIIKVNREVVTVRGKMPGEYYISVHWYRKPVFKDHEKDFKMYDSLPVTVEVQKINPYSIIYKQTKNFTDEGEARNYYKFTVNADGNVSNVTETDEDIVPVLTKKYSGRLVRPYAAPEPTNSSLPAPEGI